MRSKENELEEKMESENVDIDDLYSRLTTAMAIRRHNKDIDRQNSNIPAGYTYLGQFIAHDIAFHNNPPESLSGAHERPVENMTGFSVLDLRSLYGSGPIASPLLYEKSLMNAQPWRLALGSNREAETLQRRTNDEFLRLVECPFSNGGGRKTNTNCPIVADPRNDENLLISQLTVLLSRIHNRIGAAVEASLQHQDVFAVAQRMFKACYRSVVLNDYLLRILEPETFLRVRNAYVRYSAKDLFMFSDEQIKNKFPPPPEFTHAAFRFGHAMVRNKYRFARQTNGNLKKLLRLTDPTKNEVPLREDWIVDWRTFFFNTSVAPDRDDLNFSHKIDFSAAKELGRKNTQRGLEKAFQHSVVARDFLPKAAVPSLAVRDLLQRRRALPASYTATVADVVSSLGDVAIADASLTNDDIQVFLADLPLSAYVLLEAEHGPHQGDRLGVLGSTIVGETIVASMLANENVQAEDQEARALWRTHLEREMPSSMIELIDFDDPEGVVHGITQPNIS